MNNQIDLFEGSKLRDQGISQALENANEKCEKWSEIAYQFLLNYTKYNRQFLAEDVRQASEGIVPEPPSKRAWGGVFLAARNSKLIMAIGFGMVKNPKAHRTPATLWEVCG